MQRTTTFDASPIQSAVANASPGWWRDALVTSVDGGIVEIVNLDGVSFRVITGAAVAVGEPVSHHPVAELIASGTRRWSARAELPAA